jgi:phage terminase Nu1 subunit (DNA packaging protein)
MAVQLLSQAQYAKHRGVSGVAVHKAVKAGRITLIEGKVDPAVADIQWQANTRARISSAQAPAAPPAPKPGDDGDEVPSDYWASRARREKAEAQTAELKLAELQGLLVRADTIRAAHAKRLAGLRESLLQIPSRLAAVLAAETEQAKCHDALQRELHAVLASVANH